MVDMEVNTGVAVSLISNKRSTSSLFATEVTLYTYNDEPMQFLGDVKVDVQYGNQKVLLPLVVIEGNKSVLLGQNKLQYLRLDWKSLSFAAVDAVHQISSDSLESIRKKYATTVFGDGMGHILKLKLKSILLRPRSVSFFSIKDAVGLELDRYLQLELDEVPS